MLFCHATVTFLYDNGNTNLLSSTLDVAEQTTRVTFAVEQVDDETYKYAAAWTAPCDNFARKTGRQIASARLSNGSPNHVYTVVTGAEDYHSVFETIMTDAADKGPSRWTILDISFTRTPQQEATT